MLIIYKLLQLEADECDGDQTRGAVLVEVEAEEVCTAAPLMAVSPCHTPQKPVYTYGQAEARLLCETNAAVTGTAVLQPNGAGKRITNLSTQISLCGGAFFVTFAVLK